MSIAERAAHLFLKLRPSPSPSDTAPVPEARNACEGADCLNYDFGLAPSDVGAIPVAHNGCADTCSAWESDDLQQRSKGRRT